MSDESMSLEIAVAKVLRHLEGWRPTDRGFGYIHTDAGQLVVLCEDKVDGHADRLLVPVWVVHRGYRRASVHRMGEKVREVEL